MAGYTLLIRAVDNDHVTGAPEGLYKRGDVVVARPLGSPWGHKEGPPNFVRLDVPDARPEDVRLLVTDDVANGRRRALRLAEGELRGIEALGGFGRRARAELPGMLTVRPARR